MDMRYSYSLMISAGPKSKATAFVAYRCEYRVGQRPEFETIKLGRGSARVAVGEQKINEAKWSSLDHASQLTFVSSWRDAQRCSEQGAEEQSRGLLAAERRRRGTRWDAGRMSLARRGSSTAGPILPPAPAAIQHPRPRLAPRIDARQRCQTTIPRQSARRGTSGRAANHAPSKQAGSMPLATAPMRLSFGAHMHQRPSAPERPVTAPSMLEWDTT